MKGAFGAGLQEVTGSSGVLNSACSKVSESLRNFRNSRAAWAGFSSA